eukprot:TRINITY_DN7109_c0_g2_i1.p3 TRINITY_DN7109_c0_g2~~TRINITY_DN7109_c0_g2_i1.p3  ORF type:complete len:235 (+),score=58.04 TRINITY_DN7109_c0_g2_i1:305-1009(+)
MADPAAAPVDVTDVVFGGVRVRKPVAVALGCAVVAAVALVLGFSVGGKGEDPTPWVERVSSVIGWGYFACWSMSFYPQIYLNWVRKTVDGMSFDFQLLNVTGFVGYALFNVGYYYSDAVREDYCKAYAAPGDGACRTPGVRANDVFFSLHGLALSSVPVAQIFVYGQGSQRFHPAVAAAVACAAAFFTGWAVYLAAAGGRYPGAAPAFPAGGGGWAARPTSCATRGRGWTSSQG